MGLSTFRALKHFKSIGSVKPTDDQVRRLQAVEYAMLREVLSFCRESGIVCALAGGSALGALRHGGFIPWDDDVDLLMPRRDYERFRDQFRARFADRYWVHDPVVTPGYPLGSMRIRRKGTSVVTREDVLTGNRECGAFLDVFVVENTFDSSALRTLHGFGSLALGFLYSCRKVFAERRLLGTCASGGQSFCLIIRIKVAIGFALAFMSVNRWVRLWNAWNAMRRSETGTHVTVPVGRAHFFGELGLRSELCETRMLSFEGEEMPCPRGLERYLTRLYGPDYMTPPPEAEREIHMVYAPVRS